MTLRDSYKILISSTPFKPGRFFGAYENLSLGAGVVYSGVRFPRYSKERRLFGTAEGLVLVLSHECDVSQENLRPYNDDVLICPITPLEKSLTYLEPLKGDGLPAFLAEVAMRHVPRIQFVPCLPSVLDFGGFLLSNYLASTNVQAFLDSPARKVGALSAYGLEQTDRFFQNAFFRPKTERLSYFSQARVQ